MTVRKTDSTTIQPAQPQPLPKGSDVEGGGGTAPVRRSDAGDSTALKGLTGPGRGGVARGLFGHDPIARAEGRVVNIPAPGMTVGDALVRIGEGLQNPDHLTPDDQRVLGGALADA